MRLLASCGCVAPTIGTARDGGYELGRWQAREWNREQMLAFSLRKPIVRRSLR